jgi:hypothetical protein
VSGARTESFQTQAGEIADVSLALETIAFCKCLTPQASLRNRTQEADGSIPFSSTELFGYFRQLRWWGTIGERLAAVTSVKGTLLLGFFALSA